MQVVVIIDTNIICHRFWMKSGQFDDLFALARQGDIRVVIPRLVREELYSKYKMILEKPLEKARTSYKVLKEKDFIPEEPKLPSNELVETYIEAYKKWLEKFVVESGFIDDHDYSNLKISNLVEDALKYGKPGSNTVHFKDLVIWQSVLEQVRLGNEVHFVTGNFKDFAKDKENKEELHPDLSRQIAAEPGKVILFETLESVVSCHTQEATDQETSWLINHDIYKFAEAEIPRMLEHAETCDVDDLFKQPDARALLNINRLSMSVHKIKKLERGSQKKFYIWFDLKYSVSYRMIDYIDPHRRMGGGTYDRHIQVLVVIAKSQSGTSLDGIYVPHKVLSQN